MFTGFYLNLDRNTARRGSLTRHLEEVGALPRYRRFEAVDGRAVAPAYQTDLDPGSLGLWLTHERLMQSVGSPDAHLHLIEDDVILARDAVAVIDRTPAVADQLGEWDLIFTDVFVPIVAEVFRVLAEKVGMFEASGRRSLLDLADIPFASTSSVLINRASVRRYADLITGRWAGGVPIDLHLRRLVRERRLKAYLTVPFLTSFSPDSLASDIRGVPNRSR